jgi:ppGpp synthetase/RelA/SpoT-type nucleotidyltranferase
MGFIGNWSLAIGEESKKKTHPPTQPWKKHYCTKVKPTVGVFVIMQNKNDMQKTWEILENQHDFTSSIIQLC